MTVTTATHAGAAEVPLTAVAHFDEASAELLRARMLLSRVDRKYLLPRRLVGALLEALTADYRLLPAAGHKAATYRTVYLDTADRQMFHDHRRRRCPRYKLRIRHHLERRLSFLEIKNKRGVRTAKVRMPRSFGDDALDTEAARFIQQHAPFPVETLRSCITNEFRRITLLGDSVDERLTIDWDLVLADATRSERLPGLVIVEIKQARFSNTTPAARALRALHIREGAISKYCLATARLSGCRSESFRPMLRAVEELST